MATSYLPSVGMLSSDGQPGGCTSMRQGMALVVDTIFIFNCSVHPYMIPSTRIGDSLRYRRGCFQTRRA